MTSYLKFAKRARASSRDAFLENHPHPCLLQLTPDEESPAGGSALTALTDLEAEDETPVAVHPLVKAEGSQNPFAFMITVGRATNNDIVIPHQAVSSFHGYFRELSGSWSFADANSTYGTTVDGAPLPAERSRSLVSGAVIRLADRVSLVFLSPEELYERVTGGG